MARRAVHGEGRIGGPCHALTSRGHYCTRPATVLAADGYGYCRPHAPESVSAPEIRAGDLVYARRAGTRRRKWWRVERLADNVPAPLDRDALAVHAWRTGGRSLTTRFVLLYDVSRVERDGELIYR